jgi:predicted acyl esterase
MTDLLFQKGVSPAVIGLPEPQYSVQLDGSMRIERDVAITLTDGTRIYADVYRPEGLADIPTLLAWAPYGKHLSGLSQYANIPDDMGVRGCGVDAAWLSPYAGFEGPDPVPWVGAGYAVITVNPRATWWSEGDYASVWGEREAHDVADVIQWAGSQSWSSGKVGMTGVSYLAIIQWWVAALRPRYLAAINPCEGLTDVYREFMFHGGMPDTGFPPFWQHNRLKYSSSKVEAIADMVATHPLDDDYWATKRPDLARIDVPALVIASWSDQGLHTRGTLAAFEQISSREKYLIIHGRKKWQYFHQPSTFVNQREFFDRFLKEKEDNSVRSWTRVRYELRTAYYKGVECTSNVWPLPGRTLRTLHLDASDGRLKDTLPSKSATASYSGGDEGNDVKFEYVFDRRTDLVGSAGLHFWISSENAHDADIFVGLKKLDANGKTVDFPFANTLERGPVALGWLRASHRKLDVAKSTPDRPWHSHQFEDPLTPGEPTLVDIEIWPSGTRFEAGERLQLLIRGSDLYTQATFSRHKPTRNSGNYAICTGPGRDSTLTIGAMKDVEEVSHTDNSASGATTIKDD